MYGFSTRLEVLFDAALRLVDKPEVHTLGKEVRSLLQRVCASLKA